MPGSARRDSNLFAIDHDALRAVLADANRRLVGRKDELCSALPRVPEVLLVLDQIARAKVFAKQLQDAICELRSSRLSDGRPFREATATVTAFFRQIDEPLQAAVEIIGERLTEAALRDRNNQAGPDRSVSVGVDMSGNEVVASKPVASLGSGDTAIDLDWEVDGLQRKDLDLEALRPFFTDACLMTACRKHLAARGPQSLIGVTYRQSARTRWND